MVVVAGPPDVPDSVTFRPVAEMMPWVTLPVSPSGLPIAMTICPARTSDEWPKTAGCSDPAPDVTRITARSSGVKAPSTCACNST